MTFLRNILISFFIVTALVLSSNIYAQQQLLLSPNWQQVGQKCEGCGSALFMIYRNSTPNSIGRYEAYVYVWSNSFDDIGNAISTYISKPRVYAVDFNGNRSMFPIISIEYHLAKPTCSSFNGWNLLFYLHSSNPMQLYILEFDYLGGF